MCVPELTLQADNINSVPCRGLTVFFTDSTLLVSTREILCPQCCFYHTSSNVWTHKTMAEKPTDLPLVLFLSHCTKGVSLIWKVVGQEVTRGPKYPSPEKFYGI